MVKRRLLKENRDWLGVIYGGKGDGKTWLAIKLACMIDPDFCSDQIVFSIEGLMALVNSGKLHKGSCVIFDEAGIDANAQRYSTDEAVFLDSMFQSIRYRNVAWIWTCPDAEDLLLKIKRKRNMEFVMLPNRTKTHAPVKIYNIIRNRAIGEEYRMLPEVEDDNGIVRTLDLLYVTPPENQKIIKEYEEKRANIVPKMINSKYEKLLTKKWF